MKLNIASNKKRVEGYLNVDVRADGDVDIVMDITQLPYTDIPNGVVEAIYSEETLEHLPFRSTYPVLKEWWRILKSGGTLKIQVLDIGLMCQYYVEGKICACVPRKADSYDDYHAREDCALCGGHALIHPERWAFAFSGAQKHPFDAHLNHFTKEKMEELLEGAGFTDIVFTPNIYKIIVSAVK